MTARRRSKPIPTYRKLREEIRAIIRKNCPKWEPEPWRLRKVTLLVLRWIKAKRAEDARR